MGDIVNPVVETEGFTAFPNFTKSEAIAEIDKIISEVADVGDAEIVGDIRTLRNMAANSNTESAMGNFVTLARIKRDEIMGK
jgi:hypothetical protein